MMDKRNERFGWRARGIQAWILRVCVLVALVIGFVSPVRAGWSLLCDTPVYRYALYRWTPSPYILCRIHDGQESDPEVAAVRAAVEEAANDPTTPANILWVDVNAADPAELDTLPPFVRQRWEKRDAKVSATYYLVAPHGVVIVERNWTPSEIQALLDSPLRRQIGAVAEEAKAAAVIVLQCPAKKAESAAAERLVRETLDKIRSGQLELLTAPSVKNPEAAVLTVSMDSQKEHWLVQQLLHIESDLATIEEPMVFLVFGRGRALFSCLGKGITEENLARDIEFVSGACSCTVKEQNPGVDLLMRYDWENAASVVAEKYGGETGAEALLDGDQLFPELALPAEESTSADTAASGAGSTDASTSVTDAAADGSGVNGVAGDVQSEDRVTDSDPQGASGAPSSSPGSESSAEVGSSAKDSLASRSPVEGGDRSSGTKKTAASRIALWRVATGLGVVLVGLFAATWIVLRPRGS